MSGLANCSLVLRIVGQDCGRFDARQTDRD